MIAIAAGLMLLGAGAKPHSYDYEGVFMEGCSCRDVCVSEITGRDAGCHGMGAIAFKNGKFDGHDLTGTKVAFAWDSDKWVRVYVDAPTADKRSAATDFMKTMLDGWGKYEGVTNASIDIDTSPSKMSFTVNGGAIGRMSIKPVLGGDGKTGVAYDNLKSPMHSKLWQGETESATFDSGRNSFALLGTNGFYNLHCAMHGSVG